MPSVRGRDPNCASTDVNVFCIVCLKKFKGKLYKNTIKYTGFDISSSQLTFHLKKNNNKKCLRYYDAKHPITNKQRDFLGSLSDEHRHLVQPNPVSQPVSRRPYSSSDLGLIPSSPNDAGTPKTQSVRNSSTQALLNSQTIFQPYQAPMSVSALNAARTSHCKDTSSNDIMVVDGTDKPAADKIVVDDTNNEEDKYPGTVDSDDDFSIASMPITTNDPPPIQLTQIAASIQSNKLLVTETALLKIIADKKMPLNAFQSIFEWAIESQQGPGFDFANYYNARCRKTILKDIRSSLPDHLLNDGFEHKSVLWYPDKKPIEVTVKPFLNALKNLLGRPKLMREENLSFPHSTNIYSHESHPLSDTISELHHGSWWSDSWKARCDPEKKEILVPIIFYMDGILLDARGRLSLTPLNMTLGIFNVATRKRQEAWETIYFHPDSSYVSTNNQKSVSPIHNVMNLHNGLGVALESFKEACLDVDGFEWDGIPYAGSSHRVRMKFAIAYVIGDTELHDKLCGSYGSRSKNVKMLCRHCECPTPLSVVPRTFQGFRCWEPQDFDQQDDPKYFKSISHNDISNVFHDLDFGHGNKHNIHLATPGECLHMHQLGIAKRVIESFKHFVFSQVGTCNRQVAFDSISRIAQQYGGLLNRQSDRDLPRTRFSSELMNGAKKEGKDYAAVILCLIVALVSGEGKQLLKDHALLTDYLINEQIDTLELIIGMEEFLKNGSIRKEIVKTLCLEKMIVHFLNKINVNCQRGGMGTTTIKNHLYLHLNQYIKYWGPPTGWDSAPSESHHKTNIKAPSKTTQQNASTIINQTATRQTELNLIRTFNDLNDNYNSDGEGSYKFTEVGGSWFEIVRDVNNNCLPTMMRWIAKSNEGKIKHPQPVIDFCCEKLLPMGGSMTKIKGFTEHRRMCQGDKSFHRFRSHPSYRSNVGLKRDSWYDWADIKFVVNGQEVLVPGQILCFLDLRDICQGTAGNYERGLYAVARCFANKPTPVAGLVSKIIFEGILKDEMFIVPCGSINDTVAVVQNRTIPISTNKFFVVKNRSYLLQSFNERIDQLSRKSMNALYKEGDNFHEKCIDVDDGDESSDDTTPAWRKLCNNVEEETHVLSSCQGDHEYESDVELDLATVKHHLKRYRKQIKKLKKRKAGTTKL